MAAVAVGWRAIVPRVARRQIAEEFVAAGGDERWLADLRRGIAGRADEPGVLVLRDGKAADLKLADVHPMDRTFVLAGIGGAHQEVASRNARERRRCGKPQGRVSILFLRGERLLERRRIVTAHDPVADDGDRNGAQAAGEERVVGALVLVHVQHGERRASA